MLDKILRHFGVKNFDDLNHAERETATRWMKIVSGRDITIEDVKKFLPVELERARQEAQKYDNSPNRDLYFKAYCRMLDIIARILTTPERQRDELRAYLKQQFNLEI